MRRFVCYAALTVLAIGALWATDLTGKWTGQMAGPDGGGMTMTFNFKQDGTKLTGTLDGPEGAMEIKDGKVEGDKISFVVAFNDTNIVHEGTVKGDEITLNIKMDGGPGGGPPPMTLRRSK